MKKLLLLIAFLVSAGASQAQMQFIPTNGEDIKLHHVSNKRERKVKVYLAPSEVPADAERIGIITCRFRDKGKAILTAKNFAARAGGHAILFTDAHDQTAGQEVARRIFGEGGAFKGQYGFWVYRLKPTTDQAPTVEHE